MDLTALDDLCMTRAGFRHVIAFSPFSQPIGSAKSTPHFPRRNNVIKRFPTSTRVRRRSRKGIPAFVVDRPHRSCQTTGRRI
jgi:hypothetical protein